MLYFWKNDKSITDIKLINLLFSFYAEPLKLKMNYLKLKSFPLFIVTLVLLGCEKDDICAESTPTTPRLIIRFYDNINQESTKTVTDVVAYGLNEDNTVVILNNQFVATTDSLILPLQTDKNSTRIVLHKDYSIDDNGTPDTNDDIVLGNPDVITISYEREDVYVSRACGYKTVFNNISFSLENDSDNWILGSEIAPNTNVTNETSAHVKIFH